MTKGITTLFFIFFCIFGYSQSKNIVIVSIDKSKNVIEWKIPKGDYKQISLQKSKDSLVNFTSVYTSLEGNLKNYSFKDSTLIDPTKYFYRIFLIQRSTNQSFISEAFSISRETLTNFSINYSSLTNSDSTFINLNDEQVTSALFTGSKSRLPETYTENVSNKTKKLANESVDLPKSKGANQKKVDLTDVLSQKEKKPNPIKQNNRTANSNELKKDTIPVTTNNKNEKATLNSPVIGIGNGGITGKVIVFKTGEPLYKATISIKNSKISRNTNTDYTGTYKLNNLPVGTYSLTINFIGYESYSTEVIIKKDEIVSFDIVLKESKGNNLNEVVVKSSTSGNKRNAETVNALLVTQKNAATVSDGISAESIKKTPDRNTSDIIKRVSGASIQEDKFAIIRGLNDRYNSVFLNQSQLPSTESDRKAFAFDIFPANLLDNLTIIKTATPEYSGDFAGGLILVNTKDIPTKNFQTFTFNVGFNTQATFKERKYYKGGRFDGIGLDDGTRQLSRNIPSGGNLPSNISEAAQKNYARFVTNNWRNLSAKAPFNYSFQYVKGLTVTKKGNDFLGLLFAVTYNRNYNYTFGERNSYVYDRSNASQEPQQAGSFTDKNYSTQVLLGVLANASIKFNNNNKLSFKNILSINSDDKVITREGTTDFTNEPERLSISSIKWFTSNVIFSSQILGEHFFSKPKIKLNWLTSHTSVFREMPNLRRLSSFLDPIDGKIKQDIPDVTISPDNGGTMFFSTTKENLQNLKVDLEKKFSFSNRFSVNMKVGSYFQSRQRDFESRNLGFRKYQAGNIQFDQNLLLLNEAEIFDSKNFGRLKNGKGGFLLTEDFRRNNNYDASSMLLANYLMLDTRIFKFIRIVGGIRVEQFNQKLDSYNDNNQPVKIDSTVTDLLPSTNLIFSINQKQNLRFSFSKTLNRPEYRELAPFIFYDYVTRLSIFGNPSIKRATINNFDFRYEIYPGNSQLFALSGFYKKINNPIELVLDPNNDATAKYQNTPEAKIYGLEVETRIQLSSLFKTNFFENITLFGNLALIKSEINLGADTILYGPNRPLQGQSPYLFNAGVIYQKEDGLGVTFQVNQIGQRIFVAGNIRDMHIWENGRPVVDMQISKNWEKKNLEFKLNIKDVLAKQLVYFFDVNNNNKYNKDNKINLNSQTDKIFSTTNFGRTISASLTYKF